MFFESCVYKEESRLLRYARNNEGSSYYDGVFSSLRGTNEVSDVAIHIYGLLRYARNDGA